MTDQISGGVVQALADEISPELIEAMPSSDVLAVRNKARELHEALPGVLDMLSIPDVEQQRDLRKSMSLKLSESINHLDSQITDLEAFKKELRIAKGYASADLERIKSHAIGLYLERKEQTERIRGQFDRNT